MAFEEIIPHNDRQEVLKPIACTGGNYNSDGTYTDPSDNGVCCLYPSRALYEKYPLDAYSAWMEWQSERTPKRWKAKSEDNERYWTVGTTCEPESYQETEVEFDKKCYDCGNYFRTEEEAQQAAEAVRECLAKFHTEHAEPPKDENNV